MQRRELLGAVSGAALTGIAGCSGWPVFSPDCPEEPIVDDSISANRRSIEFLAPENRTVESDEDPIIEFDSDDSRVVITGTFSGATPKHRHEKDMILINRLQYDEQSDTLQIRLVERQCRNSGVAVAGEVTPYVLRVQFPERLPQHVCVQERGGIDKDVCVSR